MKTIDEVIVEKEQEIEKLQKEVFNLALDLDEDITAQEAKETSTLVFKLWEIVVYYKNTLLELKKLGDKRFGGRRPIG